MISNLADKRALIGVRYELCLFSNSRSSTRLIMQAELKRERSNTLNTTDLVQHSGVYTVTILATPDLDTAIAKYNEYQ